MTVLIDTNVVLDVLIGNPGVFVHSKKVMDFAEQKQIIGYISASAITDIFYIAQKKLGKKPAKEAIKKLLQIYQPATVTGSHIYQALDMEWADFEDSVQYVVGAGLPVDYIVTRNTQDFFSSTIPAVTPEQFLKLSVHQ
jgi:predicted nucleic acid-binding protein